jgi:transcriptional regulator with XRE-family HTH domain
MKYRRPSFDPTRDEVLKHLKGLKKAQISRETGISPATIRNWETGKTRRPQHLTMEFALRTRGLGFVIRRIK